MREADGQSSYAAPKRYPIFNTYVNALSLEETVSEVDLIVASGVPTQHVVLNASKVNLMRDDACLTDIVNACPLINADGASIVWAARQLGVPLKERVAGIDLFLRLVELASEKSYGIYLLGAKDESVFRAREALQRKYPNLKIVGFRNGYFDKSEEPRIVADIAASGADMLFLGFSSPKKEYWAHEHLRALGVPFVMGVGGSFDVVAGVTVRAPKWMQDHGLEWLFRFAQEPGRLWRRYVIGNASFIRYVFECKIRKQKR
ncbi:WecB/TagA/CpsF family glycosyltransferase [Gordonibacter massiliensis (ex Traore et al. 2017)]|uniref:WecB/TagA/CpsF family glycosyltransferase n=1 Tax=Gordonibacter massiliensis (ex Traore et al. 2017) TaxID=1841863 RepID=A0A842JB47_9ACTN|nr:WecB/TagA/CpsF family glycosyltransferase [Gordonibacter massiliensis (ex Traore et al. 2017)]MBC2888694.1 WecB/TagA/CpsF family glycosyltransferase [Gordonibacter massiliensis (ex Traore et al. 2017)]